MSQALGFETNAQFDTKTEGALTFVSRKDRHGMILIEYENKDENYMRLVVDLTTDKSCNPYNEMFRQGCQFGLDSIGRINLRSFNDYDQMNIARKSESFILSKEKIEAFLENVKKRNGVDHPFCVLGVHSIKNATAQVVKIHDPLLEAINRANHTLFKNLYDSMKNNGLPTGMDKKQFDQEIEKTMVKIATIPPDDNSHEKKIGQIKKYVKNVDIKNIDLSLDFDGLMQLMKEKTSDDKDVQQDNCCTFAEKELNKIGIDMPKGFFDVAVSDPHSRADHRKDSVLPVSDDLSELENEYYNVNPTDILDENEEKLYGQHVNYNRRRSNTPEVIKNALKDAKSNVNNAITTTVEASMACLTPLVCLPFVPSKIQPIITTACIGAAGVTATVVGVFQTSSAKEKNKKIFDSVVNSEDANVQAYRSSHPEKFKEIDPNNIYKVFGKEVTEKLMDEANKKQ
jgi:hypothetical protein